MDNFFVTSCSGCFESEDGHPVGEYPVHPKHGCYVGSGCKECGYHGVRRVYYKVCGCDQYDWCEVHGSPP